jgi:hypothetical protein
VFDHFLRLLDHFGTVAEVLPAAPADPGRIGGSPTRNSGTPLTCGDDTRRQTQQVRESCSSKPNMVQKNERNPYRRKNSGPGHGVPGSNYFVDPIPGMCHGVPAGQPPCMCSSCGVLPVWIGRMVVYSDMPNRSALRRRRWRRRPGQASADRRVLVDPAVLADVVIDQVLFAVRGSILAGSLRPLMPAFSPHRAGS